MPCVENENSSASDGWWTRDRVLAVTLAALTLLLLWLCYRMAEPFLPAFAWAVALAIVAHPIHAWMERHVRNPGLAAGLAVILVAFAIIVPTVWVGQQVASQAGALLQSVESGAAEREWHQVLRKDPRLEPVQTWLQTQFGQGAPLQHAITGIRTFVAASIGVVIDLLITLFFLFFLFRDRHRAIATARSLVPLSAAEAEDVFTRIADTIHASIYGTLVVSAVQGTLGGLMFWWLGLPGPLVWGLVMGLLAIVPVLGAFVIWVPAAIYLGMTGHWGKAVILTLWGTLVVGLIDNLLYPVLVGKRLRLHTAAGFVAIVGGLALFGASGIVLGPVVLAITLALLDIWRRRTRGGRAAESALST